MKFIVQILLMSSAVIVASYLLPGVRISGIEAALIVALVLALLNYIIKPLLIILTFPLTIISLGLFLLVINALIIIMADSLVSGFEVDNFWWALLFSLLLSLINSIFLDLSGNKSR